MKVSIILSLAAALLVPIHAGPISLNDAPFDLDAALLQERQSSARKCNKHVYSKDKQGAAIEYAIQHDPAVVDGRTKIKAKNKIAYPKDFDNDEGINLYDCESRSAPFREFPILRNGQLFMQGDEQKADRVIYKIESDKVEFCAIVTHQGAKTKNDFKVCPAA